MFEERKEHLYKVNISGMPGALVVQATSRARAKRFIADSVLKVSPLTPIEAVALTSGPDGVKVQKAP